MNLTNGFDRTPTRIKYSISILLGVLCACAVQISAQDWHTAAPGVEYATVTKEISGLNVNMNLLRLDLTKVRLDVVHAMDAAIGTEKVSSIATRHGAFAAINAGFFRLDSSLWAGEDVGLFLYEGRILSESTNHRIALGVFKDREKQYVEFGHWNIRPSLQIRGVDVDVSGVDRERKPDEVIVYTSEFGRSTLTEPNGLEAIVSLNKIQDINENGSSSIPQSGYVISANGKRAAELRSLLRLGQSVDLVRVQSWPAGENDAGIITRSASKLAQAEYMIAGVPQLIKDGKIDITWLEEKASKSFVETRHPRTAVAKLKDGKFLMITVDGRTESSGGIGLQDLAEYLLSLGATDAMNLDGGGSTTMFLDGKVVNHPSDKDGERKIGDALLVTLRNKQ